MTLGPAGEILSLNRAGERITGYSFAQVRGRPYTQVFPDLNIPGEPVAEWGRRQPWTMRYYRPDGEDLSLDVALLALGGAAGSSLGRVW